MRIRNVLLVACCFSTAGCGHYVDVERFAVTNGDSRDWRSSGVRRLGLFEYSCDNASVVISPIYTDMSSFRPIDPSVESQGLEIIYRRWPLESNECSETVVKIIDSDSGRILQTTGVQVVPKGILERSVGCFIELSEKVLLGDNIVLDFERTPLDCDIPSVGYRRTQYRWYVPVELM